ncbi:amidohydrolase family protein [uncultured Sphingomonas sp.]|uniref:N-acyl-D-amino-acid deacylase family protein n=1 Tax=uncultured Sphingomonas sp. TaxID=158754 RepID=UPI00345BC6BE
MRNGRIAAVGTIAGEASSEIDATGLIVTPGFVDIHTHYDGQATWEARMQPSSWHGVTTVVMGNCGVGFAPCRPADRSTLVRLMEGVEDIPYPVLIDGLPWDWETFPDYLDSLAARSFDVEIGAQLPHAPLRVYAMGERAERRLPANRHEIALMRALACEAVETGALGFSTSRTIMHRAADGSPTPTLAAEEQELLGIAMGLADAGAGVLQFVSDFDDPRAEFAMLRRLVEASGRPLSFSLVQSAARPDNWKILLDELSRAVDDGLPMRAQVCGRPVGMMLGFELSLNPFVETGAYQDVAHLPLAERAVALAEPAMRRRLLADTAVGASQWARYLSDIERMLILDPVPDYEARAERSVGAIARDRGMSSAEVALDHMLSEGGQGVLYLPFLNYADYNLDACHRMLTHRDTVSGLSDGGAHVGTICDASFPTSMLTHWTRDRSRGPRLSIAEAVALQTSKTAAAVGLTDRGTIRSGMRADLNIIDYAGLVLHGPEVAYDLPSGGRRLLQRAEGYRHSFVGGIETYRDGRATGALPGGLIRAAPCPAADNTM